MKKANDPRKNAPHTKFQFMHNEVLERQRARFATQIERTMEWPLMWDSLKQADTVVMNAREALTQIESEIEWRKHRSWTKW